MVIKDKFTSAERTALDQARRLLGNNLSAFLLSGLGDTQITHRRTFTARSGPEQGDETAYQLEMTNDSEQGLPIGTDPLVMAHLLKILREEMRMADNVDFNVADLLKALGWSQTLDSHLLIKQAVERYALTNFCLIDQAASDAGSRSCFQRLLIGYVTISKSLSAKAASQQLLMKMQFFPSFIYGVFGQRKSFLGIDFSQLQNIREISS
jgi:hypothetical protein